MKAYFSPNDDGTVADSPWPLNEWCYVLNNLYREDRTRMTLTYKGPTFNDVYLGSDTQATVIGEQNDNTPAVYTLYRSNSTTTLAQPGYSTFDPEHMFFDGYSNSNQVPLNTWYTPGDAMLADNGSTDNRSYAVPTKNPIFDITYEDEDYQISSSIVLEPTAYNFVIGFSYDMEPLHFFPENELDYNNHALETRRSYKN